MKVVYSSVVERIIGIRKDIDSKDERHLVSHIELTDGEFGALVKEVEGMDFCLWSQHRIAGLLGLAEEGRMVVAGFTVRKEKSKSYCGMMCDAFRKGKT